MALRAVAEGVFADVGATPTVLALHGWGRSRADWTGVFAESDVVAVDLPGFGASPAPSEVWGAHEYASAIRPILDLFASPPVVVGHSFGGRVAVALAADGADIAGLVLAGVPLLRPDGGSKRPPVGYRLVRWAHGRGLIGDDRMERARRAHGSADYRSAEGTMRDILVRAVNETYETELAGVRVPVRMVWGSDDTAAPLEVARAALSILVEAGVDASLHVEPGVGHDVHRLAPRAISDAVESLR